MANIEVTTHYPNNPDFDYESFMELIDLDATKKADVSSGKGFIVSSPKPIKDDIKDPNGIFSDKFGMTLQDIHPFQHRYKCKCGALRSKFMVGQVCSICGTTVRFVDDDFGYFGWIVLKDPYRIIHPTLFMSLAAFVGADIFNNIIKIHVKRDEDGNPIDVKKPKNEPYFGIGMDEFYNHFQEIMDFYRSKTKSPNKIELYNLIMENKDKIFTHSIPVFTTILRPYKLEGGDLHYEGTNAIYKMMSTLAYRINSDKLKMTRKSKTKNELLYDLQMKIKKLFDEINLILSGKKGIVRQIFGGRFNFSSRSVIVPDPTLRPDQVRLSYPCLCVLLQQRIINILCKSQNMSYHQAYIYLDKNLDRRDPLITQILRGIIRSDCGGKGIPIIINRNPTLIYGGILQSYIIDISEGYTMTLPLNVLKGLAADQIWSISINITVLILIPMRLIAGSLSLIY